MPNLRKARTLTQPPSGFALQVQDVDVGYFLSGKKKKILLNKVNFDLAAGEMLLLEGSNGAGKTTLAKTILGFIPVLSGIIRRNFIQPAFVPQHSAVDLIFPVPLHQLVAMGQKPQSYLRKKPAEFSSRKAALLDGLKLQEAGNLLCREASGGQLQRALIGRALMQQPDFIILDEPFANLDAESKTIVLETLLKLNKTGVSILVIDHHQVLPRKNYSRRLVIEDGYLKVS